MDRNELVKTLCEADLTDNDRKELMNFADSLIEANGDHEKWVAGQLEREALELQDECDECNQKVCVCHLNSPEIRCDEHNRGFCEICLDS